MYRMMSYRLTKVTFYTFWTCQMLTGGRLNVAMQLVLFQATMVCVTF